MNRPGEQQDSDHYQDNGEPDKQGVIDDSLVKCDHHSAGQQDDAHDQHQVPGQDIGWFL